MNQEQIVSLIRQMLLTFGGALVGKGYMDDGTMTMMVGGIMALGTGAWAIYTRRRNGLIASAAALPQVSQIVTTAEIAQKIPNEAVVSYEYAKNSSPAKPHA